MHVERPQNGVKSHVLPGSIVAQSVEAKHIPGKSIIKIYLCHYYDIQNNTLILLCNCYIMYLKKTKTLQHNQLFVTNKNVS